MKTAAETTQNCLLASGCYQETDIFEMMYKELEEGHQIYVIAPLIEESETLDLTTVNELKDKMEGAFGSKYNIGVVHGKLSGKDKDKIMDQFAKNKIQILISTTVIEVGVDVPNTTMIVIFDANRFGLSTLHQLRGRVGRSNLESKCILISDTDAERLKEDIKNQYKDEEGRNIFWEAVPLTLCHDNYKIEIKECRKEDILEIDTFDELVAIDPSYKGYKSEE